jgi:hypothetical protein
VDGKGVMVVRGRGGGPEEERGKILERGREMGVEGMLMLERGYEMMYCRTGCP